MKLSTKEMMLALRAPQASWLAALVCAIDEALLDEDFSESQRAMVRDLLEAGSVPSAVALAAQERLSRFEHYMDDAFPAVEDELPPSPPARQKLTVCGSAA